MHMIYESTKVAEAKALINAAQSILITTHVSPDGDAIGSSLGLQHILKGLGKSVQVVTPNKIPSFLNWMPDFETILVYEGNEELVSEHCKTVDLIFCLDFNDLARLDKFKPTVEALTAPSIMIDHHIQPSNVATVLFSDTNASSTCQMIYEFADALAYLPQLNTASARCLYTGLVTDTGSFRFSATTSKTHQIAAELIAKDINHAAIQEHLNNTNTFDRLQLMGYVLSAKMVYLKELKCIYFSLTQEEMERFNHKDGDTEGLVNYGLSVGDVQLSVFFKEAADKIKISFRSKGDFSVQQLAKDHFNGGGHFNASGGASFENLEDTINRFLSVLPNYTV